jgi:hypothetical protein
MHQPDLVVRWQQIQSSWTQFFLWLVLLLMPVNWGIEAIKWKLLVSPLEKISFFKAFKSVLAGCSITMLTPNRTGEFGGRILFLEPDKRLSGISATIVGSMSQLIITIIIGTICIVTLTEETASYKLMKEMPWIFNSFVFFISSAIGLLLLFFFFRLDFCVSFLERFSFLRKALTHISFIHHLGYKILLRIIFYSLLRYLVFILQYIFLLKTFRVDLPPVLSFELLSVFYLMMAIVPTIGFTELPVRATASILLLGLFSDNVLGIQVAAFGIWLINLALPSLLGSIFILSTKIVKEK